MRSTTALLVSVLAAISIPSVASAQTAAPLPTPTAPLPPVVVQKPHDSTSPSDALGLPTRLALLGSMTPTPTPPGGCSEASVDSAGTILPLQPHISTQLTMHLTLEAVSNLGCPGDPYAAFNTGMGAALTHASLLRPNLWLVASAGAYAKSTWQKAALGADLVWKEPSGQTTSVGIGAVGNGRGARVMPRVSGSF